MLIIHNEVSDITAKRAAAAVLDGIDIPEGVRINHHNGDLIVEPDDLQNMNLTGELNDHYRESLYLLGRKHYCKNKLIKLENQQKHFQQSGNHYRLVCHLFLCHGKISTDPRKSL